MKLTVKLSDTLTGETVKLSDTLVKLTVKLSDTLTGETDCKTERYEPEKMVNVSGDRSGVRA